MNTAPPAWHGRACCRRPRKRLPARHPPGCKRPGRRIGQVLDRHAVFDGAVEGHDVAVPCGYHPVVLPHHRDSCDLDLMAGPWCGRVFRQVPARERMRKRTPTPP